MFDENDKLGNLLTRKILWTTFQKALLLIIHILIISSVSIYIFLLLFWLRAQNFKILAPKYSGYSHKTAGYCQVVLQMAKSWNPSRITIIKTWRTSEQRFWLILFKQTIIRCNQPFIFSSFLFPLHTHTHTLSCREDIFGNTVLVNGLIYSSIDISVYHMAQNNRKMCIFL